MRSNQVFDREVAPPTTDLEVTVVAVDRGVPPMSSTITIPISVEDVNDNDPVFLQSSYSATIREDTTIGTSLLRLTASDRDVGLYGAVRFVILEGDDNEDFRLDSHLGHMYVQKRLDYERQSSYSLRVEAQDMGNPPRADVATIQLNLTDVNDMAPRFVDAPYVAWVKEGITQLPVHILDIRTKDGDSPGRNSRVLYSIMDGSQGIFSLNNQGHLTARSTLDRELRDEYHLLVQAADMGEYTCGM